MENNTGENSFGAGPENPPTLVAESAGGGTPPGVTAKVPRGRGRPSLSSRKEAGLPDKKPAKMPVLQPNVSITAGPGTRTKSGRIHKPTRNFSTDEYVVPNIIKKRMALNSGGTAASPPNTRDSPGTPAVLKLAMPAPSPPATPPQVATTTAEVAAPTTTESSSANQQSSAVDIEGIKERLIERFPYVNSNSDETPFTYLIGVCFKDHENTDNVSESDVHARVRNSYKNWTKGPYKLKDDEIKFVLQCIVKPEWDQVEMRDWQLFAEAMRDRMFRMRKRFARANRFIKRRKDDVTKWEDSPEMDNGVGEFQRAESEEVESKNPIKPTDSSVVAKKKDGKSLENADFDLSLGAVGIIDDFAGEDIKEELFDDLESALDNESKSNKVDNSMVAALHATLQKDGGPSNFDPAQFKPPGLEDVNTMFGLEDIEGGDNSCNFFESTEGPTFVENPTGLSDEAFAELEQRVVDNEAELGNESVDVKVPIAPRRRLEDKETEQLDLSVLEIEESSGNLRVNTGVDMSNLGETMISIKTALMCALKISEDFLPSSHEKYLDRLEETDRYAQEDLDFIRKRFHLKPSAFASQKRKLKLTVEGEMNKKPKVALVGKIVNGAEKPKPHPYLRSSYAKCRKFMEDETTVIEKLGDNKILAGGRILEIEYENYLKESDIEIPLEDISGVMPTLPPPTVSNCHAPSCRLGCICSSISEDMPPRAHCGRPRCFFECTCNTLLFNSNDDGDIRSRLRPRVSLLNWRAESTEKEKEPMTSYRQMERGTHFIRVRRPTSQPERLRREFVLDGKVVDRNPVKVTKERLRTKALLQSSHRRIMAKPGDGHRFMRIVPAKAEKPKVSVDQLKKKCQPFTIDVEHMDVEITEVPSPPPLQPRPMLTPKKVLSKPLPKLSPKDLEEMRSIIQEMTEDCQLMALDDRIGFFSWAKGNIHPKVVMYQVTSGDQMRVPWLYMPIPPQGYSWICHNLTSSFEKTDYVYIPEIKCCISSHALKVNMNTAIVKKKGVMLDIKAEGQPPGIGKIYLFPDLPKMLICGPFKTDQITLNNRDLGNVDTIGVALQHMEKLQLMKRFGDGQSWKRFINAPTIYPIKKRTDNEFQLSPEESRRLFEQVYPSIVQGATVEEPVQRQIFKQPKLPPAAPVRAFDWSHAVKFVGLGNARNPNPKLPQNISLTELVTL